MKKIIEFFRRETVLSIAGILAVGSMFVVPPSSKYIEYIDFRVLALLFSLMIVVCGMRSIKVFDIIGEKLLYRTKSIRSLATTLVLLCFFSAMVVTNDVALLTFVPFTIMVLKMARRIKYSISIIIFETIAANLGSMLTPIGNPQNLYLYNNYSFGLGEFIYAMLPLTVLSLVLLMLCMFTIKNEPLTKRVEDNKTTNSEKNEKTEKGDINKDKSSGFNYKMFTVYVILFIVCILCVAHILDYRIMLAIIVAVMLITSIRLFKEVDYMLLLTFVAFFVFIGNMQNIEVVKNFLSEVIEGRELLMGVLSSQVISNVPAAILLSGFTENGRLLLYGVNIGGLGTLIASLASLISFRGFRIVAAVNDDGSDPVESPKKLGLTRVKYIKYFTFYNIIFLVILYAFAAFVL